MRRKAWDNLSPQQRAGMTRRFWDGLPPENQRAFADPFCILHDGNSRIWGSPYCEDHVRRMQEEWTHAAV